MWINCLYTSWYHLVSNMAVILCDAYWMYLNEPNLMPFNSDFRTGKIRKSFDGVPLLLSSCNETRLSLNRFCHLETNWQETESFRDHISISSSVFSGVTSNSQQNFITVRFSHQSLTSFFSILGSKRNPSIASSLQMDTNITSKFIVHVLMLSLHGHVKYLQN